MIDSLPGMKNVDLLKTIMVHTEQTILAYSNLYTELPVFFEVFQGFDQEKISNSVYTLELLILANLMDMVTQFDKFTRRSTNLVMENSIFWPYVWIYTFTELGYLSHMERDFLIGTLKLIIVRFFQMLRENNYFLVYEFIHMSSEENYQYFNCFRGTRCYYMTGKVFSEHPNFWKTLMNYFPEMKKFVKQIVEDYHYNDILHIFEHHKYINFNQEKIIDVDNTQLSQAILDNVDVCQKRYTISHSQFQNPEDLLDFAFYFDAL